MEQVSFYIGLGFGITVLITAWLLLKACSYFKVAWAVVGLLIAGQSIVAASGFYTVTDTMPPRFLLLVLPPLLFIVGLLVTNGGREFIDSLDGKTLTLLHVVRVPVEVVLFWLMVSKVVPKEMTFEGRNFDILSGISAVVIYYWVFVKQRENRIVLLVWNIVCLILLVNVVTIAALSLPTPFQKMAFGRPNVAVLYFPFVLLPGFVVPVVLFSHLVMIRRVLVGATGRINSVTFGV